VAIRCLHLWRLCNYTALWVVPEARDRQLACHDLNRYLSGMRMIRRHDSLTAQSALKVVNAPLTVLVAVLAAVLGLQGCAAPPRDGTFLDPHEAQNRATFAENLAIEATLFGEAEAGASAGAPPALAVAVSNFGSNLGMPSAVANSLLQGRPGAAIENVVRFAINTTIGVGGIFDPAARLGVHGRATDFGETLYVWGVNEGAYLVLPVLGPSTERDAFGTLVGLAVDPMDFILGPRQRIAQRFVRLGARLGDRVRYADLVALITDSADPYAQARLFYLQNRRFQLGQDADEELFDPYDDF
jgi:phospholipid-binding lipoprotein MlaA